MKSIIKKIIALTVVLSFSLVQVSFAQTDTSTASSGGDTSTPAATTPAPTPDPSTTTPPPTDPTTASTDTTQTPPAAPVVQDTTGVQTTVSGTTLEDTTDPQSASSSVPDASVIPVTTASSTATSTDSTTTDTSLPVTGDTASSTPLVDSTSTATTDVVGQSIDTTTPPPVDPTVPTDPQPVAAIAPISVPIAELAPKPQYAFAITGTTIPTKLQIKDSDGNVVQEQSVLATLTPTVDNTTGEVSVSGTCTDVYYVVLLFKNKTDYADDPSSYLVNRAYPCVGGTYTYAISDLPDNLTNGTYYLMVGQEGEKSPWQPITSLTEIQINKNP